MAEQRHRTPLRNVRGAERTSGDPARAARLAAALRVSEHDAALVTEGLHAVHPFPGRLHPGWVRALLRDVPAGARVYDPFCGGGTVLVEARLRGLACEGSDLHPLAVRLSRLKTGPAPDLARLAAEAERCAQGSARRRETPFSRLARGERGFLPHVLATLIALRDELERCDDPHVREVLLFSLTPLLDKLSSRADRGPVAMSAPAVRQHFVERTRRWAALFEALAAGPPGVVHQADARRIPLRNATVDVVVSSPPYPGVYDYAAAQARWARWLGVDVGPRIDDAELGRAPTREDWLHDMRGVLLGLARVLRPGGDAYLVIADGVLEDRPVFVDAELPALVRGTALEVAAVASQARPHFHRPTERAFRRRERHEHLVLLRRRDGADRSAVRNSPPDTDTH